MGAKRHTLAIQTTRSSESAREHAATAFGVAVRPNVLLVRYFNTDTACHFILFTTVTSLQLVRTQVGQHTATYTSTALQHITVAIMVTNWSETRLDIAEDTAGLVVRLVA